MKTCKRCGHQKSRDEFSRHATTKDQLQSNCKACASALVSLWRAVNPEANSASCRKWKAANADRRRAYYERTREANATEDRARALRWIHANPDKSAAATATKRAQKLKATPAWSSAEEIASVYATARATTMASGVAHHVDHVIPLKGRTVCGLHVPANLSVIPAAMNLSKGNRTWPGRP